MENPCHSPIFKLIFPGIPELVKSEIASTSMKRIFFLLLFFGLCQNVLLGQDLLQKTTKNTIQSDYGKLVANYEFEFTGLADTSKTLPKLKELTPYFWRVKAKNATDSTDFSAIWKFTTQAEPIGRPRLAAPENGASVPKSSVLTWRPPSGASGSTWYEVQVAVSNTFDTSSVVVIDTVEGASSSVQILGLAYGKTYYWRVRGRKRTSVTGAYSDVRNVKTFVGASKSTYSKYTIDGNQDGATSVYAADIDGDGDMDVLSAGFYSGDIMWYENNGSEVFTKRTIDDNQDGATSVYAADVDGDGDMDVLSAGWNSDDVMWYENNGNEVFAKRTIDDNQDGARDVYAADVDGDGDLDVLSAGAISDDITWYENNGNEIFTKHTIDANQDGAYSVYTADVDGDSDLDVLAVGVNSDKVVWYENTLTVSERLVAPTLASPANGAMDISLFPTLSWSSVNNATAYDLQVATNGSFTAGVQHFAGITVTSKTLSGLAEGTQYFWRVRAKNSSKTSDYSSIRSFTTEPISLGAPRLASPSNGAMNLSLFPTLSWSAVKGATRYDLQVSTSFYFTRNVQTFTNMTSTYKKLSGLAEGTQYFWRVRAKNSSKTSEYSSSRGFTTEIVPLGTPRLTSPANYATGVSLTPTLSWNAVSDATLYDLQIATNLDFTQNLLSFTNITTTTYLLKLRANGTQYFWRVRAKNSTKTSEYSDANRFTITYEVLVSNSASTLSFVPSNPSRDVSTDYRMFSLPCNVKNAKLNGSTKSPLKVSDLLTTGTRGEDWEIHRDNGNTTDYYEELTESSQLTRNGEGFWIWKDGGLTVPRLSSSHTLDRAHCISIPIHSYSWNIIGNPYNQSVAWSSVRAQNATYTTLWEYKGAAGYAPSSTMVPYKGYYYLETQGKNSLQIPYPNSNYVTSSLSKEAAYETASEPIQWKIQLKLRSEINQDNENYIGVCESASNTLDKLDSYKPPMFEDQSYVVFERPEWNEKHSHFASDIRPTFEDGAVWDFHIINPAKGNAKLQFAVEALPAEYQAVLVDSVNSAVPFEVLNGATYAYDTRLSTQSFKLIVGTEDYVEATLEKLKPDQYELLQNYPNPFNPETVIGFRIKEVAHVKIEIYNVLGQKVKTLVNKELQAGLHNVVWNGRTEMGKTVSSGVYLYRMIAGGKAIGVKKMVLLR